MIVAAIDAGNSRIKWGLHGPDGWFDRGVVETADAGCLGEAAAAWPDIGCIAVCNVAGPTVGAALAGALEVRHEGVVWLRASAAACGVSNRYDRPDQLGADRWAALIGAWGLVGDACLVVCAGTATTVDLLDAHGVFQGGAILPGFDLMRRALARETAQLPLAAGVFVERPRSTDDAIVSGCLHAQAGAIERLHRQLPEGSPVLLTGGAAPRLVGLLSRLPVRPIDNLVLEGLVRFARETAPA